MTTSNPTKTHEIVHTQEPKSPKESKNPKKNPIFIQNQENNQFDVKNEEVEEEEEEGECGFCLFMKAGGCRETFIDWEKCAEKSEENQEDIVEKCYSVTKALRECMEANDDHYGPILRAEKAAVLEAERELEKEIEGNVGVGSEGEVEGMGNGVVLRAEKAVEMEVKRELEKEIEDNVGVGSEQEVAGTGAGVVSETVAVIEVE